MANEMSRDVPHPSRLLKKKNMVDPVAQRNYRLSASYESRLPDLASPRLTR